MRDDWSEGPAMTGGCQCGAVRFAVPAGPGKASVCHCRMCQRATGNAFAPLIEVEAGTVAITGQVTRFASSNLAERGFCALCGTPLFYQRIWQPIGQPIGQGLGCGTIEIMAGAIDAPWPFDPVANHGVEARMPWLSRLGHLPDRETFFDRGETLLSHQSDRGR